MTAKALGRMMGIAGLNFVYYNGAITSGQKAKALQAFQHENGPAILVSQSIQHQVVHLDSNVLSLRR